VSDDSYPVLKNADRITFSKTYHPQSAQNSEGVVKPWRDISTETMPQAIKNLLKPHWSAWILTHPEYAKNNPGAKTTIIVKNSKSFDKVSSLRQVRPSQPYFVFREKPAPQKVSGGGPPLKAEYIKDAYEPEPAVAHPDRITILEPVNHAFLRVGHDETLSYDNPDGPFTVQVNGVVTQSSTYQVDWHEFFKNETRKKNAVKATAKGENIPWQDQISGLDYGEYTIGAVTENGISHSIKVTIKPEQIRIGELLYRPDKNTFYLIDIDQYNSFISAAQEHDKPLKKLAQAYKSGDQEQVNQAKGELDKKLEPLVDGATDTSNLVELIGVRGKKSYFMEKNQVLPDWHEYGPIRGGEQSMALNDKNSLNMQKLKEQFDPRKYDKSLSAKATYSWDLVAPHSDSFGNWAKSMNRTLAEILDNQDNLADDRKFDYSAQAQVMRYSYGTSLNRSYNLKEGEIDLSLESEASFALAEGKVTGNWYIPNAEGKEIIFTDVPTRGSRAGQTIECNIGSFRFKATAEISGFAGASLQASAGLTFGMEKGKPKVRGSVKKSDNEKENYVGVGGEAFAGIKGTGSLTGSGEWKNPEKGHDWVSLLELGVSATAAAGLALKGDFCVDFQDGRLVLMFSGSAVCVAGGGGEFACTIGVKHIADFMIYLYHELKNEDFHFVEVITAEAFDYYVTLSTYGLVTGEDIRAMYELGLDSLETMAKTINKELQILQSDVAEAKRAEQLAKNILANISRLSCQPPEAKGQLLYSLSSTFRTSREEKQEEAIIAILQTAQTWNDYVEIVSHCSPYGQKISLEDGEKRLRNILDFSEEIDFNIIRFKLKYLQKPKINTAAVYNNLINV